MTRQDLGLPARRLAALAAALMLATMAWAPAFASEPCNPPNVIPQPVCDMDTFRGSPPRQLPNGWTEFVLNGDPTYMQDSDTFWGAPSLRIWSSGGTFKAGIYTQVNVTPGAGYRASIAWGAPTAPETDWGRQLGIDPTGGTDPNSPNVVWGPMHWGPGRILNYPPPDVNIDVRARALADTVTVFFLVDHPRSAGNDLIFVDAIALYPDESAPAAELPPTETPTPEPTPVPAAPAPAVAAAPTATPVPPTATPTPTDTPLPTPTATATSTPTPTHTPTPLPTATWTPWPTATPLAGGASLQAAQAEMATRLGSNGTNVLLAVGLLCIGGAGLFGSSLLWLRRRK